MTKIVMMSVLFNRLSRFRIAVIIAGTLLTMIHFSGRSNIGVDSFTAFHYHQHQHQHQHHCSEVTTSSSTTTTTSPLQLQKKCRHNNINNFRGSRRVSFSYLKSSEVVLTTAPTTNNTFNNATISSSTLSDSKTNDNNEDDDNDNDKDDDDDDTAKEGQVVETSLSSSIIEDDGRHDEIVNDVIHHFLSPTDDDDGGGGGGDGRNDGNNNDNNNESADTSVLYDDEIRRRANVQLTPGWGKTLLSLMTLNQMLQKEPPITAQYEQHQQQQQRIVIYVTPNLILVDQFLKDFDQYTPVSTMIPHDQRLIVASKSNRTEICTTSSETISEFLSVSSSSSSLLSSPSTSSQLNTNLKLLVCTYNSLPRVGKAIEEINNNNDTGNNNKMMIEFAIFDEAHTMEGIGERGGYGLDDTNLPIWYRFFLTATPRNYIDNPKRVHVLASKQNINGGRTIIPSFSSMSKNDNESHQQQQQVQKPVRSFANVNLFGACIARIFCVCAVSVAGATTTCWSGCGHGCYDDGGGGGGR